MEYENIIFGVNEDLAYDSSYLIPVSAASSQNQSHNPVGYQNTENNYNLSGASNPVIMDLNTNNCIDDPVYMLLKMWKLENMYQTFVKNEITIDVLKVTRRSHIAELLPGCSLGVRILFEDCLAKWQRRQRGCDDNNTCEIDEEINPKSQGEKNIEKDSGTDYVRYNLEEILGVTVEGRRLLEMSKFENAALSDRNRDILVEMIINYFIQKEVALNVHLCGHLSEQIIQIFQKEIKEIYFVRIPRKTPKGMLFSRYHNRMRKLRDNGLINVKENRYRPLPVVQTDNQRVCEPDGESIQNRLKYMREEDRLEDIKQMWGSVNAFRKNTLVDKMHDISNILKNWPSYSLPLGHELLSIDFEFLHQAAELSLFNKWETFCNKIIPIFKDKIKDKYSKEIFQRICNETHISEDGKHSAIIFLLHSILVPTSRNVSKINGKNVFKKFTIEDSRNTFLIQASTLIQLKEMLKDLRNEQTNVQPLIGVVADDQFIIKEIYVFIDNITYKFFSIVKALDICFKSYHVFDLVYPKPSFIVWQFIQIYFYGISTKYDENTVCIKKLTNDLNAMAIN